MIRIFTFLTCLFFFSLIDAQVQFPTYFPKQLINKVICGHEEVNGIDFWTGKTNYGASTDFDYKIYISEKEGIYVKYNPGEKFHRDQSGTTEKITKFPVWEKLNKSTTDQYGDIIRSWTEYKFKVYPDFFDGTQHHITSLTLKLYNNGDYELGIEISVRDHESGFVYAQPNSNFCETLKSQKELEQEKKEELAFQQKLAAEQKILAEKAAIVEKSKYLEIDKLMSQGKIEDANAMLKTLSQPEFYPNKSKLEQSFAPIQLKNIEAILVRNNIDSAIILYNSMPESVAEKTTAEKKIQYELNTYYKTNGIPITQAAWDDIWDKGRSKLEKLPNGEYKLEVLSTGEVRINGLYSGFSIIWGLPKEKRHKLNQRFKYVEIQQSTLTIKKDERIDSQIFYANCTKQIAKNNTTNEYRLIKGDKHETNETIVAYKQDINLEKNHYKIIGKVKISKLLIVKVEGQEISIELNSLLDERTLNQGLVIK
jgi:hypothetical protein